MTLRRVRLELARAALAAARDGQHGVAPDPVADRAELAAVGAEPVTRAVARDGHAREPDTVELGAALVAHGQIGVIPAARAHELGSEGVELLGVPGRAGSRAQGRRR